MWEDERERRGWGCFGLTGFSRLRKTLILRCGVLFFCWVAFSRLTEKTEGERERERDWDLTASVEGYRRLGHVARDEGPGDRGGVT